MIAHKEPWLTRLFRVRPQETQRALLLFAHILCAVGVFIMGRNARDTLFLSHYSRDVLTYMYISQAFVVALPAWGYARYTNHFRRDRLLIGSLVVMAAGCLVLWALLFTAQGWVYVALYNWVELMGALMMIQFWTFAGDVFSSREAKRLFPFIGGGGVLANILVGGIIVAAVKTVGVQSLLLMMAVLLCVCCVCVYRLGQLEKGRLDDQARERRSSDLKRAVKVSTQAQGILQSTHLKIIAGMTCITFVAVQFVDFQFKSVTREAFQGPELAQFYGYFTVATGVLAAVAQFGLSARILENFGVVWALLVLPATLLMGNLWVVVAGASLYAVTFTQGAQTAFRYSIYDATMQVIYTPVPANQRGRAKSFIDGILKPAAIGGAGLVLWVLTNRLHLGVGTMAYVALVVIVAWLALVLSIKREYVRELLATLRRRRLNFDEGPLAITDAPTVEFLRRTLESPDPRQVRNALELVPRVTPSRFAHELEALGQHPQADIRARAVALLGHGGALASAGHIADRFKDDSPEVRAAAVRAFCLVGRERALSTMVPFLSDADARVRAAAVAGLIAHGGLDGILQAADPLKRMLEDPDAGVREHAARVLAEIRVRNFYQPVLALLRDPSPRVQNAALQAAGEMQSPELIPALVYKLGRRETAHTASRALARYGESILDVLEKVLARPEEDLTIRRQVPRILAAICSHRTLDLLLAHLDVPDPALRREVARAAARVKDRLGGITVDPAPVERIITKEVQQAFQLLAALEDVGGAQDQPSLLRDSLGERVDWARDRIFRLLAIIYPSRTVDVVFGNLSSPQPNVRANAVEVLDNMLSKNIKRVLITLVEEQAPGARLRSGAAMFRLERKDLEGWLRELMGGPDPWLRVCAVHEAGERGATHLADEVAARLEDPDAVVRETAARTMARLLPRDAWTAAVAALREDRSELVRSYATSLVGAAPAHAARPVVVPAG